MGSDMLPPFSLAEALGRWQWAPVVTVGTAVVAAVYLWGVFRVARRHPARPWPPWRTGMFLAGLLVVVLATESGVGSYDDTLFWDHMIQHLMLIMIAPALLVAGQPVTLLLHASRNPLHTWTKRFVRSRAIAAITWPPLGIALYTATIVGTHLTGFMNLVLTNDNVHNAEHVLYVIVGYLYLLPLVGSEPIRWRLSYPIRMIFLFIAMPVDAFTGVALGSYSADPFPVTPAMHRPWGPAPLDDVHIGGAVMWVGGSAIMFVLIMVVFLSWARSGQRADSRGWLESARRASLENLTAAAPRAAATSGTPSRPAATARPDRTGIDEDDDQLAAYNAFLARINQGSQQSPH
ncbi:MAG TPA: cytochrome c oxidase assembly protein [Streptosporangiaceae bacterium]|nr:cytochrome c oxidase assembly protein [Streptosporangiaceae bacterium]